MGEIQPKTCEGRELTKNQLASTMQHSAEHVIDHLFATEGVVCVGGPEVGPLPREGGQGPWGAGDDHDGSDHAWLRVSLQPKI